ncbi:Hypothetical protein PHPALM_1893 [Phytophthora palmivora]|uniref:SLC26A/SulP transporter domain-containing protein n=1 Tax=Phytophthora palmivora TaxID=4796 RepID=A0A2P4YR60_9STRA|nr:Hypothetical protein PHPALM_1893 [Phytophthora palmivora]
MAKCLAIQRGEDSNTEQELTRIGIASVICGFFQAKMPTGGMSRIAVNMQNAHKKQLASIVARLIAKWLYRVKRDEFLVWTASFILTFGLGVLDGFIAPIVCSLLALMIKTKHSPVVILGKLENGSVVTSSLYFTNCERVAVYIEREMTQLAKDGVTTRGVVLSDTQGKLAARKVRFAIANAKIHLKGLLSTTNLLKRLLSGNPIISVEDTIRLLRATTPSALTSEVEHL